jgi:LruC domain-containing protein
LNCIIRYNEADNNAGSGYGGGVRLLNNGEIRNCLIYGNTSVKYGGGINIWNKGYVYNCTVIDNTAPYGAGIRTRKNSSIKNTILYFNNGDNWEVSGTGYQYYNCCTTPALGTGYSTDCITDDPLFVDVSVDDYHLQASSPCKDSGYNMGWMTSATDLDGNNRIIDVTVDIGCYELATSAPPDDDGDGVPNSLDDFPDDPNAAFLNYFPAAGFGSLAFEDLWPGTGDYDFNDIVVDYRFAIVTNADNKVYYITATFPVKASGAYLKNGFGFNLPDANSGLNTDLTVSGSDIQEAYITLEGNGLESGQTYPTIIVFDDVFNILPHQGTALGVNTEEWALFVPFDTVVISITPVPNTYTINDFSLITWNPFIIVDHDRGVEVHLPDHLPTDLADPAVFGTFEDDSDPATERYYKTVNNLPWAINIVYEFEWPTEKANIGQAYLHFIEWAESEGVDYPDWYEDNTGYRNDTYIYSLPAK